MRLAYLLNFAFSIGGVLLVLAVTGGWCVLRPRSRAARAALVAVAFGYGAMSIFPIPHLVNQYWSRPFAPLTKAEVPAGRLAIVVLGSGSTTVWDWSGRRGAVPDPIGFTRTLEAARLYALLGADWVVSSGGPPDPGSRDVSAAEAMRDALVQLGVPASRVVMKGESHNTRDEAVTVAALLPQLHVDHVVLVTSGVHMRRAAATFRAAGVPVIPAPARDLAFPPGWMKYVPTDRGLYEASLVAHEILGFAYYRLRGWR